MRAVAQHPAGVHQLIVLDLEAARRCRSAKPWRNVRRAYAKTFAIQLAPLAMVRIVGFAPDQLASVECRRAVRIGDRRLHRGIGEAREASKFLSSSSCDGQRKLGAEIAEKEEWRRCREFLAHEHERRGGG